LTSSLGLPGTLLNLYLISFKGTGESGKSTIAKQMKIIHLNGFTDEERKLYTNAIHNNIYLSMRAMIQAAHQINVTLQITPVHSPPKLT